MNKLPNGWELKKIGKIANIKKGHQLNKLDMISNGKYPVINGGIEPSGYINNFNTQENTITISEGGNSCGYVNFISTKFWCGGHCYKLENIQIDKKFLFFLLKNEEKKIMKLRIGSGLPNIQKKDLLKIKIPIPKSLKEQQKIAEILSEVDRSIETTQKIIEKEKRIKKGLMQDLLRYGIDKKGNIRNPNTHRFKNSELGLIPEEWEVKKLSKIAEYLTDGDWIETKDLSNNGIWLIQTGNIGIGKLKENKEKRFISEKTFQDLNCKMINKDDILICRLAAPIGRACVYNKTEPAIVSVDITICRVKKEINVICLNYILNQSIILKQAENLSGGSTRQRISRKNLEQIKIPLPKSLQEQQKIAEILSLQDEKIEKLNKKLTKLKKIKKALMQDLLTAKVRVTKLLKD